MKGQISMSLSWHCLLYWIPDIISTRSKALRSWFLKLVIFGPISGVICIFDPYLIGLYLNLMHGFICHFQLLDIVTIQFMFYFVDLEESVICQKLFFQR